MTVAPSWELLNESQTEHKYNKKYLLFQEIFLNSINYPIETSSISKTRSEFAGIFGDGELAP